MPRPLCPSFLLPPPPPPDASPSSKPAPPQVRNASGQILHAWRGAKFLAAQALVCFVLPTWKWSGLWLSPSLVTQVHILCNTTPAEEYSKLTSLYWIVKSPPPRQIHTQTSYMHTHGAVKGMEATALRLTLKAMEDICSHISPFCGKLMEPAGSRWSCRNDPMQKNSCIVCGQHKRNVLSLLSLILPKSCTRWRQGRKNGCILLQGGIRQF